MSYSSVALLTVHALPTSWAERGRSSGWAMVRHDKLLLALGLASAGYSSGNDFRSRAAFICNRALLSGDQVSRPQPEDAEHDLSTDIDERGRKLSLLDERHAVRGVGGKRRKPAQHAYEQEGTGLGGQDDALFRRTGNHAE